MCFSHLEETYCLKVNRGAGVEVRAIEANHRNNFKKNGTESHVSCFHGSATQSVWTWAELWDAIFPPRSSSRQSKCAFSFRLSRNQLPCWTTLSSIWTAIFRTIFEWLTIWVRVQAKRNGTWGFGFFFHLHLALLEVCVEPSGLNPPYTIVRSNTQRCTYHVACPEALSKKTIQIRVTNPDETIVFGQVERIDRAFNPERGVWFTSTHWFTHSLTH